MDDAPSGRAATDGGAKPAARRRGRPAGTRDNRDTSQVQSIRRALTLLEAMSAEPTGVTLTALASRVGLAPSTTHRLLKSLEQMRFVQHDEERSLWLIGVRAFAVGSAFLQARDFVGIARSYMRRLMEESGESVNLAILDDGAAVCLAQVECHEMMRALAEPGGRAPLHGSGVGKAILAALPERQLARLLRRLDFTVFTERTIDGPERLRTELAATRERGYAIDDEEFARGLRCVAAAIHDEHGEPLAAISLSGPSARVTDERLEPLGRLVARTATEITGAIGGRLPRCNGAEQT